MSSLQIADSFMFCSVIKLSGAVAFLLRYQ